MSHLTAQPMSSHVNEAFFSKILQCLTFTKDEFERWICDEINSIDYHDYPETNSVDLTKQLSCDELMINLAIRTTSRQSVLYFL